ncbi:MAG TPA: hypothetical protein PLI03_01735 [Chitinophagales bacterium]|nr:hypothetical protein [Chitinophagales bacterium]
MKEITDSLKSIRANADRLLRLLQASRQETALLKNQLDTLRAQVAEKNQAIDQLRKEMDVLKTAQLIRLQDHEPAESTEDQEEVKRRINTYIKEIDSCIRRLEA